MCYRMSFFRDDDGADAVSSVGRLVLFLIKPSRGGGISSPRPLPGEIFRPGGSATCLESMQSGRCEDGIAAHAILSASPEDAP
jgi:hypothetical protein